MKYARHELSGTQQEAKACQQMGSASARAGASNELHAWPNYSAKNVNEESGLRITSLYGNQSDQRKPKAERNTRQVAKSSSCCEAHIKMSSLAGTYHSSSSSMEYQATTPYQHAEQIAPSASSCETQEARTKVTNEPELPAIIEDEISLQQKAKYAKLSLGKAGHKVDVCQTDEPPNWWQQNEPNIQGQGVRREDAKESSAAIVSWPATGVRPTAPKRQVEVLGKSCGGQVVRQGKVQKKTSASEASWPATGVCFTAPKKLVEALGKTRGDQGVQSKANQTWRAEHKRKRGEQGVQRDDGK